LRDPGMDRAAGAAFWWNGLRRILNFTRARFTRAPRSEPIPHHAASSGGVEAFGSRRASCVSHAVFAVIARSRNRRSRSIARTH
jgi:hypothetical protein